MIRKPNVWFQKLSIPHTSLMFSLHPPPLSGNSNQASCIYLNLGAFENPPPPKNFQSLPWREYGYFLELHISITVLLFFQNNSQLKNIAKTCLPPSMLRSSSIVHVQGCSARQIFSQIANVALRVVFLLFLPCFSLLFRLVLTLEASEMSAIFVFITETTPPRPQVFSVNGALTCKEVALLTSSVD